MKYSTTIHTIIAIVGFLILSAVQFFLVYNTYELKNRQYYLQEKGVIAKDYGDQIRGDLVFPGGAKILDSALYGSIQQMENYFRTDRKQFDVFTQRLCDSTFRVLHNTERFDTLLAAVEKKHGLRSDLNYKLTIDMIEMVFGDNKYIPIYSKHIHYKGIADSLQTKEGAWIGGTLEDPDETNNVTSVNVGGVADRTYRITWSLYVDTNNRKMTILGRMMPTFILSLFSILTVVLLFFVTLKNWIKQKKLSEMKSDFINSITHEFHTPLAAIIVANKTLQNEKIASSRESVQPLTEVIQRQSDRLKSLIGQVLDITTMNQVTLKKEEHSVHHLLEELLLDYRLRLSGNPVVLTLTKNATRDEVLLDSFWFTTALLNIFDNAIKYNRQELKEITVTTANDKKNLLISIADNGIGMSDETRRHLFDKFYRDTELLTGEIKGLGLGLYYVKQAIDAHSWKIEMESKEGMGSVFTITIPLV
jgi:two-component system phosphate regulon sensor histidine kinase PhoR